MIIQIEQGYNLRTKEDVYNVKLDNKTFGQFIVPEKNGNIRFNVEWFADNDTSKPISETISAIFNKPVELHTRNTEKQIINADYTKVPDVYVLMHTKRDKYNVQSFMCFDDRIGSVHIDKTATGKIKDITFNAIRWALTAEMVPIGARQLVQLYKQDIKLNIAGRSYIINQKTPWTHIDAMCDDAMLPCYYDGKQVGLYKYTENGINFTPDTNTPLPQAVLGAAFLRNISGKPVNFMSPNKQYSTLVKLFTREFNRKNNK